MLAALEIINQILNIRLVQYFLLIAFVFFIIYTPIRIGKLKYDNALLKSTVGDISQALYVQNRAIEELGTKAKQFKENYEQANKRASQVALEGQKTLQRLMDTKLIGSCDEKVKQVGKLVKESVQ